MIWLLLVPVLSWLDRQRGMPKDVETIPKLPALLGIGYVCSVLTGHWMDWQALVITLSVAVIHNFSFGNPLGTALTGVVSVAPDGTLHEKWQVGNLLKSNPWVALSLRGAMLGMAGLLAMDYMAAVKIALAWAIAFPLSPFLVRYVLRMPVKTIGQSGRAWATNEWTRGALAGLLMGVM